MRHPIRRLAAGLAALLLGASAAGAADPATDGIHLYDCTCRSSRGQECTLGDHVAEWWIGRIDPKHKTYTGYYRGDDGSLRQKTVRPDERCTFNAEGFDCLDFLPPPSVGGITRRLRRDRYESELVVGGLKDLTRCRAEPARLPK